MSTASTFSLFHLLQISTHLLVEKGLDASYRTPKGNELTAHRCCTLTQLWSMKFVTATPAYVTHTISSENARMATVLTTTIHHWPIASSRPSHTFREVNGVHEAHLALKNASRVTCARMEEVVSMAMPVGLQTFTALILRLLLNLRLVKASLIMYQKAALMYCTIVVYHNIPESQCISTQHQRCAGLAGGFSLGSK